VKGDLPSAPDAPPRKRRVLQDEQATPDLWLARWAGDKFLAPSQRRAAQDERDRRKAIRARGWLEVLIVRGVEGATPPQRRAIAEAVPPEATGVTYLQAGVAEQIREAVQRADLVIAAPRESTPPSGIPSWERSSVWAAVAYAKHRRIAVKIIMPTGEEAVL